VRSSGSEMDCGPRIQSTVQVGILRSLRALGVVVTGRSIRYERGLVNSPRLA
jgi:hypothetical protein